MSIPKQAIDAAAKAIADSIGHGMSEKCFDHARDALTAAAPYMSGVKVKQLEWVEIPACNGLNTANTQFGTYTIGSSLVVRYGAKSISKPLANLEEAKTVAQADYEKRILNALEPSPEREHALDEVFQILQQYSEHPNEVVSFVMVELWDAIRSLKSKPAPL